MFSNKNKKLQIVPGNDDSNPEENDDLSDADIEKTFVAFVGGDRDGSIDFDIISRILKENNVSLPAADITHLIETVDTDGNGTVELDEFSEMMRNAENDKTCDALPFILAGKRQALKEKRMRLKGHSTTKSQKELKEKLADDMAAKNPTVSENNSNVKVELFEKKERLHWKTRERIEWNVYFADAAVGGPLVIIQPFKDYGWTLYDSMACELVDVKKQMAEMVKLADKLSVEAKPPEGEFSKQQVSDFLALRVKYTPSDTPDQLVTTLATSVSAPADVGKAGLGNDVLKRGSGTILLQKLANDTIELQKPVPHGLEVPDVEAMSTNAFNQGFVNALAEDIQNDIKESADGADKSNRYMKAAAISVDLFKEIAKKFEEEKKFSNNQRKWRTAIRRVIAMLAVDEVKILLREKGYDETYLGDVRENTRIVLHDESYEKGPTGAYYKKNVKNKVN